MSITFETQEEFENAVMAVIKRRLHVEASYDEWMRITTTSICDNKEIGLPASWRR